MASTVPRFAKGPGKDPSLPHVALAVADIQAARKELDSLQIDYWAAESVVGPQSLQLFLKDPFGNIIELHQLDTCRCVTSRRSTVGGGKMA